MFLMVFLSLPHEICQVWSVDIELVGVDNLRKAEWAKDKRTKVIRRDRNKRVVDSIWHSVHSFWVSHFLWAQSGVSYKDGVCELEEN